PIGPGLTLGPPSSAVPLAGVGPMRIEERGGRVVLLDRGAERPVVRGRPLELRGWRLLASGPEGRAALTVFAAEARAGKPPAWFPYDPRLALTVTLAPPAATASQRVLAPDGVEVLATEAGTVQVTVGDSAYALRVLRLPGASEDESELEIYFRDATNGKGTYPSGRFVSLIPREGGRYHLDFNRARNPFCAYNTAFPCPAPWRGNVIGAPVPAGERYAGGGLDSPIPK
ncbi:MAG: DUF1684 domain-containing protein, partial [Gemmatimonadales bacterium]|nr:DUF1684 domain-containing protein [Gemmatimonadales bacterium]